MKKDYSTFNLVLNHEFNSALIFQFSFQKSSINLTNLKSEQKLNKEASTSGIYRSSIKFDSPTRRVSI